MRSSSGRAREVELDRARRRGGDRERERAVAARACRSAARRSARERRSDTCRNAVRALSASAGRKMLRSNSPGSSALLSGPVTKSATAPGARRRPASRSAGSPSSAAVSEIIGPAGSDMQMLPPTVAAFQILNEARKARQHWSNQRRRGPFGRPSRADRVARPCRWRRSPGRPPQVVSGGQPSVEIDQPRQRRSAAPKTARCRRRERRRLRASRPVRRAPSAASLL